MIKIMSFPSKKKLRSSGILFSFIFGIIFGIFPYLIHGEIRLSILIICCFILAISFLSPYTLRIPYSLWLKIGNILGIINSNLILVIFFYIFITPFGILRRLYFLFTKIFKKKKISYYSKDELSKKINFKDQF